MSTIEKAIEKLSVPVEEIAPEETIESSEPLGHDYEFEPPADTDGQTESSPSSSDSVDPSDVACNVETNEANTTFHRESEAVVEIPFESLAAKGMVTLDSPRSQVAEEYRIIKRPLLTNISGKTAAAIENPNLIMVTSSLPGEGKTFMAINLAMSMSMERDKTVLFVDGDISKASAGSLLGIPDDQRGLIDVLVNDDVHIEDVLLETCVPNLKVIPAGRIHERATELLASQNMLNLTNELSTRYSDRIVIFDSPPLLLTTEARVLANSMGQVVFVVAAEQTSNEAAKEALGYLADDKAIGMVLNKAKRNLWDKHRYGYGYGYGYGSSRRKESVEGV